MTYRHYLLATPLVLACALPGISAAAQQQDQNSLAARLDAQEARIQQLENARNQDQSSGLKNVRVSGYINVGAQKTNLGSNGPSYLYTDNEWKYSNFMDAGLQVDADITDKVSGTIQLLSQGNDNFNNHLEWGYITYHFTPNLKARAGRLVAPLYMHSQYYHVGYAYPWIQPPAEVYDIAPIRAITGVDLTWQFTTGSIAHTLNVYEGNNKVDTTVSGAPVIYNLHDAMGINLSSSWNNLNTWLGYSRTNVNLDLSGVPTGLPNPYPQDFGAYSLNNDNGYFGSVGFQYDNGSLLVMGEHAELGIGQAWFPTTTGDYLTLGYHIGRFLPNVTWAESQDHGRSQTNGDPIAAGLFDAVKTQQKSWTFGVRADVAPNLAVKAEVSTYYDIGDSNNGATPDSGHFSGPIPAGENRPTVYRIAANLVF